MVCLLLAYAASLHAINPLVDSVKLKRGDKRICCVGLPLRKWLGLGMEAQLLAGED
jgi:hypothetical protein